jgi:hypothetical protein
MRYDTGTYRSPDISRAVSYGNFCNSWGCFNVNRAVGWDEDRSEKRTESLKTKLASSYMPVPA